MIKIIYFKQYYILFLNVIYFNQYHLKNLLVGYEI